MGLKPIAPGLRNMQNNSSGPTRVSLVLPPGDELLVSEEVAKQLTDQSPQLVDLSPPVVSGEPPTTTTNPVDVTVTVTTPDVESAPAPAKKAPAKKAAAKKAAAAKPKG